jgi:hypothetical protein
MSTTLQTAPQAPTRQLTGLRALAQSLGFGHSPLKVESTVITSFGYDRHDRKLSVTFASGAVYEYGSVPASVYREFAASESKGRFFAKRLRGKYPFIKVA